MARQLAEHFGVPHDYLLTEDPDVAPGEVVERFLEACGGTMEQMSAYLDGMRLWASLPAQEVEGIIRGDEGFPFRPVHTLQQARTGATLVMLSDFMDEGLAEALGDGPQVLPEDLRHREGESVIAYRNRIYHAFRIPVGLAALTDVKTPFVEVADPPALAPDPGTHPPDARFLHRGPERLHHRRARHGPHHPLRHDGRR